MAERRDKDPYWVAKVASDRSDYGAKLYPIG